MKAPVESDRVDLLIVAGEASGDLHGARLLAELRPRVPGLAPFGLGGEELAAAGLDRVADSGEISVVGLTEVLKVLPRAREIFDLLLAEVDRRRPRLAVLIDFPEFNLRLAKALKERGVPVVYYISPQVWAWRRGRVKTIAELVDEIPELPHVWDRGEPAGEPYQIALLPGSRVSEVEALLPVMLETVRLLAAEIPLFARLIRASTVPRAMLEEAVELSGLPVRIVPAAERFEAVASSHFALCASGTATLEVGLLGTPMAVLYRLGSWTYLLGRLLVRLPYVSLVNLVLGREAVPELLQARAHPERVRDVALSVLRDPAAVAAVRADLAELRGRLGESGASARAAREVAARLPAEVPA